MLYSQGYREHSHYCLIQAIRALFVETEKLDARLLRHYAKVKVMREKADYELEFSKDGAQESVRVAKEFLERAKELL
jgi:uncharacterized protein (UPF0332 family)